MKGLLYKDLLQSKASLIFILVTNVILQIVCIICSYYAGNDENAYLIPSVCSLFSFYLVQMLDMESFSGDARHSWYNFAISTPGAAKGNVKAKYIFLLAENLLMAFSWFITDAVMMYFTEMSINIIFVIYMSVNLLIFSLELPLVIRFGNENGMHIKESTLGITCAIFVLYLFFGNLSFLKADDPIAELIKFIQESNIAIWTISLLPYVAVIAYFISYKFSVKYYAEGAENYEE